MKRTVTHLLAAAMVWLASGSMKALDKVDGWYRIATAQDLVAFSRLVADGEVRANAMLLSDIDATGSGFEPIGSTSAKYHGTFDGQGHRVRLDIHTTAQYQGLFGCVTGGCLVANTIVEGEVSAGSSCAGLIGGSNLTGIVTVLNCGNEANVTSTGSNPAGIIGVNMGTAATFVIRNCYNTGAIKGKEDGGICGWANNGSIIENCWNIGESVNFVRGSTGTNCYTPTQEELQSAWFLEDLGSQWEQGDKWPMPKVLDISTLTRRIGTAAELEQFARDVNEGQMYLNAVLTDDIDATELTTLIGTSKTRGYQGTFDGQGHRLRLNISSESARAALCPYLFGTVRNLHLSGTISSTGQFAGSVAGSVASPALVSGVVSDIEMIWNRSGDGTCGGIVGVSDNGGATVENSAFVGTIDGQASTCGGIVGWSNSNNGKTLIRNCFFVADISIGGDGHYTFSRNPNNVECQNCYYLDEMGGVNAGCEPIDPADLTSGALCYLLNGNQQQIGWWQTIGADQQPWPFGNHKQVYANGRLNCDGTSAGGSVTYSNTNQSTIPPHNFVDGYCDVCGTMQEDFLDVVDGVYQIGTAAELCWFSDYVAAGHTKCDACLTEDIDMAGYDDRFQPIGNFNTRYQGNFDGKEHRISNLIVVTDGQYGGLFGCVTGSITIRDIVMDETCAIYCGGSSAGLVGAMRDAGTVTLRGLGNEGEVTANGVNAAGILGVNFSGTVVMEGCWSMGYISGTGECGALSGWVGSGAQVTGCWSTAEVFNGDEESTTFSRQASATYTNCYYTKGTQVGLLEPETLDDGGLCYRLNGDQSHILWYQTLGEDEHPLPYSSHKQVYAASVNCDNTPVEGTAYNNTGAAGTPAHDYLNDFCRNCGHENPDAPFLHVIVNPDNDSTDDDKGWKDHGETALNYNAGVAEHWNHTFDTYQRIGDLQGGVYKLQVQGFYRAGQYYDPVYADGKLSEEAAPLMRNSYFYAQSGDIDIAARFMDIMEGQQERPLNNTTEEKVVEATGLYIPDGTRAAASYFAHGLYHNEPLYVILQDGDSLTIGVRNQHYIAGHWTSWDTWRLSYVGDNMAAYNHVKQQATRLEQFDIDETLAQRTLLEDYAEALHAMQSAGTPEAVTLAAALMSHMPERIKLSQRQYAAYDEAIQRVAQYLEEHDDFSSLEREQLEEYLDDSFGPNEDNPLGSYLYIMEERQADGALLAGEAERIEALLAVAIQHGLSKGTDLTSLIQNADMAQADFAGWTFDEGRKGESGTNKGTGTGFTDIMPTAKVWNMQFDMHQDIGGSLPEGVYELGAYALYRPGANEEMLPNSVIPLELYMNDFQTPVMSIFDDIISYGDAINGSNCRFDSEGDDDAPHNGEQTWSHDYEIMGEGYVPDGEYAASFAFRGGRYYQKVYGLVTDGKMRIGLRHTGSPWYEGGLAMWGAFDLRFMAKDAETEDNVFLSFRQRLDRSEELRQDFDARAWYSTTHVDELTAIIQRGLSSRDEQQKFELLKQANQKFHDIAESKAIYLQLYELMNKWVDEAGADVTLDYDIFDEVMNTAADIEAAIMDGIYSDQEALDMIAYIENHTVFSTIYAVGDLVDDDAENGRTDYSTNSYLYPLHRIEGTKRYQGTVRVQDRTNMTNSNGRAGVFFLYKGDKLTADNDYRFFVTPAENKHKYGVDGHAFQMLGGEWQVEIDTEEQTVEFTPVGKPLWNNQAYMVGTFASNSWNNNETVPMQHVGDGVYMGIVNLQRGTGNINAETGRAYCELTIFATRGTTDAVMNSTSGRDSWTSCRYGSITDKLPVAVGETVDSLSRDHDRKWLIADPGTYLVEFDMNHETLRIDALTTDGRGTVDNPYIVATQADLLAMRDRLQKGRTTYFRLTADIDLDGKGWYPLNTNVLGNSQSEGYTRAIDIDGGHHIIKNLRPYDCEDNVSFAGTLVGSIRDLGFWRANVQTEGEMAGVIAGTIATPEADGTILRCYASGTVTGLDNAGGLAAMADGVATLQDCYANVAVTGSGAYQGGLVAANMGSLSLTHCYAAGEVSGPAAGAITAPGQTYHNGGTLALSTDGKDKLTQTVPTWAGWHQNGTIGNGFPIMQWQVERGDHVLYCGFEGGTQGDVNGDGSIDVADVVAVYNAMASGQATPAADVNGDGSIDVADVVAIYNTMAARMKQQR